MGPFAHIQHPVSPKVAIFQSNPVFSLWFLTPCRGSMTSRDTKVQKYQFRGPGKWNLQAPEKQVQKAPHRWDRMTLDTDTEEQGKPGSASDHTASHACKPPGPEKLLRELITQRQKPVFMIPAKSRRLNMADSSTASVPLSPPPTQGAGGGWRALPQRGEAPSQGLTQGFS